MKKPNFFIIGAPKCGTTSLAAILENHPQIFFSPEKEPHFFGKDIGCARDSGSISRRQYERLFMNATDEHKAVGEGSVYYLHSKVAIDQIEKELPGSRFIVMLRNPSEMAVSMHKQQIYSGREKIKDFEEAWAKSEILADYLDVCKIGSQVFRLFEKASKDRILLLTLNDLKNDPRALYEKVLVFLEVESDGRTEFVRKNSAKVARSMVINNGLKKAAALRRQLGLPWLGGVGQYLRGLNSKEEPTQNISAATTLELDKFFKAELDILSSKFNIDLV